MKIIFFLAILTAVSAVSVPSKIEQIGFPSIPKNDYIKLGFFTIKILQDVTEDLGLTMTYNLTKDGQPLANEGPELICSADRETQWGSMLTILSTALNIEEPNCPHPKGEHQVSRNFDLDLMFDDAPSCKSKYKIAIQLGAPDVEGPILDVSFKIFPKCDDDDGDSN